MQNIYHTLLTLTQRAHAHDLLGYVCAEFTDVERRSGRHC